MEQEVDFQAHHQQPLSRRQVVLVWTVSLVLLAGLSLLPQGGTGSILHGEDRYNPETGEYEFTVDRPTAATVGIWTGAIAGYVLLLSPLTGHRPILERFLPRRTWVRLHAAVGLTILGLALVHAGLFLSVGAFATWPGGTAAVVLLAVHGWSGAMKTRFIVRLGAAKWRALHVATGWVSLALGVQHAVGMNLAAELFG